MWHRILLTSVTLLGACSMTSGLKTSGFGGSSSSGGGGSSSAQFTMPDLFRMKKDDAIKALQQAGFQGDISWDDQLCGSVVEGQLVELGEVCRQSPPAGREQPARLPVRLLVQPEDPRHGKVGQFGEWHLMPEVVGLHVDKALAAMKAAGFKDERTRVDRREDKSCKPNYVCQTYPAAMERAGQGSDRVLIVGADPGAKPPPADPATPKDRPGEPPVVKPPPAEPDTYF
ncbi:MAG: PASTA domain-containing protein [Myxococcales bacterium]|nr:PASTA domain-containing protein [Myxococcales bacterium]